MTNFINKATKAKKLSLKLAYTEVFGLKLIRGETFKFFQKRLKYNGHLVCWIIWKWKSAARWERKSNR